MLNMCNDQLFDQLFIEKWFIRSFYDNKTLYLIKNDNNFVIINVLQNYLIDALCFFIMSFFF